MRDTLLAFPAGPAQLPVLAAARRLGLRTIAFDRSPSAPGLALADVGAVASAHDPGAILAAVREAGEAPRVAGVVTKSSGAPGLAAAVVAETLGLSGLRSTVVERALAKGGALDLAEEAGLAVPRGTTLDASEDGVPPGLSWPLVTKPSRTLVGKRGISLVRDERGWRDALEVAREASADGRVRAEEFALGEDVVAAGLVRDSAWTTVVLYDEHTRFDAAGRVGGAGLAAPSRWAGTPVAERLERAASRFVEHHRIGTGLAFLTFRACAECEPRLIEVHLEPAGDLVVDELLPAAGGYDLVEQAVRLATGRDPLPPPAAWEPVLLRYLFAEGPSAGVLARLVELGGEVRLEPRGADAGGRVGHVLFRGAGLRGEPLARAVDRALGRAA